MARNLQPESEAVAFWQFPQTADEERVRSKAVNHSKEEALWRGGAMTKACRLTVSSGTTGNMILKTQQGRQTCLSVIPVPKVLQPGLPLSSRPASNNIPNLKPAWVT